MQSMPLNTYKCINNYIRELSCQNPNAIIWISFVILGRCRVQSWKRVTYQNTFRFIIRNISTFYVTTLGRRQKNVKGKAIGIINMVRNKLNIRASGHVTGNPKTTQKSYVRRGSICTVLGTRAWETAYLLEKWKEVLNNLRWRRSLASYSQGFEEQRLYAPSALYNGLLIYHFSSKLSQIRAIYRWALDNCSLFSPCSITARKLPQDANVITGRDHEHLRLNFYRREMKHTATWKL
jgi:hypothetical protein